MQKKKRKEGNQSSSPNYPYSSGQEAIMYSFANTVTSIFCILVPQVIYIFMQVNKK